VNRFLLVLLIVLVAIGFAVNFFYQSFFTLFFVLVSTVLCVLVGFSFVVLSLVKKDAAEFPFFVEGEQLARQMHVKVSKFKVTKLMDGAFFSRLDRTLVVGEACLKFPNEVILAIIAHELAHSLQTKKIVKLFLQFMILPAAATFLLLLLLDPLMQNVAGLFFSLVYFPFALHKINWALEFDADKTAVKFVGQNSLEQALLLASGSKVNRATLTHPSPAERIRRSKSY